MRGLASTSILASTQEPPPSTASFSSTGESCLHGPHQSAQKSITTGVVSDRSSTSVWKVASVTSMTVTAPSMDEVGRSGAAAPPFDGDSVRSGPPLSGGCGEVARSRSPLRSIAPRMTVGIAGVVRGSMVI